MEVLKCVTEVKLQDNVVTLENRPDTPRKILRKAIFDVIVPQPSAETQVAVANAKKQRKHVQAREGEVVTKPAVLERLKEETEARSAKKKSALKKTKKSHHFDDKENDNKNESRDEEINETRCIMRN